MQLNRSGAPVIAQDKMNRTLRLIVALLTVIVTMLACESPTTPVTVTRSSATLESVQHSLETASWTQPLPNSGKSRTDTLADQSATACSFGVPLRIKIAGATQSEDSQIGIILVFAHVSNTGNQATSVFSTVELRDQRGRLFPMISEDEVPGYNEIRQAFGRGINMLPQSNVFEPNTAGMVLLAFKVDADASSFQIVPVDSTCY